MNELHASLTVAARVRDKRQENGWSMRELAERSGLPEDVIEAIENNRRRRGVTVDELMVLAHALNTVGFMLLPSDFYYYTDEQKQRYEEAQRQREAERPKRSAEWAAFMKLLKEDLPELLGDLQKIPPGAVIAIERDGKLVPVEQPPRFLQG